ncbi:recombinase family protein [Tateyamaria sp. ANG-S1]|uniref:recombinase family protein n=1 Tax=Tateyamaria sp. ANG-S1 TaxID=1577905 RepID=UPI00068D3B41|nr:recombinase family protein [Tateyamaria sp. ANG-S1]
MNQLTPPSKFVVYYRVSTKGQKESGLGLEAQQQAVDTYLAAQDGAEVVTAIEEVESGKNDKRPQLAEALKLCKIHKATLPIAKLDRLARKPTLRKKTKPNRVFLNGCPQQWRGTL